MARTEVRGEQIKDASVSLTADVTGTLPVGNGGTGATSLSAADIATKTGTETLTNKTLTSPKINQVLDSNGAIVIGTASTASAANHIRLENRASGDSPVIRAVSSDTNAGIWLFGQGTGGLQQYVESGDTATFYALGTATDIHRDLITQGAGVVKANGVPVVTTTGTQTLTNKTVTSPQISNNLLGSIAAGAVEYDGAVFYNSTSSTNRGLNATYMMCRLDSAYTLSSSTSVQKLFNSSANGALTLPVGTYRFNCLYSLSSMSATSGNGAFSLAGTATLGTILMDAIGRDGSVNTVATLDGQINNTAAFPNPMHTAQTAAGLQDFITGTFEVTVAGTIIPSFALNTAASAVVAAGSFFECWQVGSTTVATIGNWS